jgi:DNA-binding NtrC family response regulator
MSRICLIEDDPIMGESLTDRFVLEGFALDWFRRGGDALEALNRTAYDAVISDVRLPDLSGEEIFRQANERIVRTPPFIFITAFASVERAVSLLKQGAADYVTKPFDLSNLVAKVHGFVGQAAAAPAPVSSTALGVSAPMRHLAGIAPRVAARARTVLITGESGSGKEVLARHLHRLAPNGETAPFVAVNCAAIPETLLEDALFGHEKGAFTGADRQVKGCFEQAHGGTLFLDEIGELSSATQVKLLRAVQERSITRLGGASPVAVDVRVFCATHRDLRGRVSAGQFREDLYYRIAVVELHVPPLRERPEDVLWFARRFLDEQAQAAGEAHRVLTPAAQAALLAHPWPGNVRELKNRIERACILGEGVALAAEDLFAEHAGSAPADTAPSGLPTLDEFLNEAERGYLQAVLARFGGRIGAAAAALGISRKTLWDKMRRHALRSDDSAPG